ncbi:hypothetical protein KBZ21_40435, partial [Streptomyces sp. A73]|nr:hypothetical protein [Streptomyces sp. A73]
CGASSAHPLALEAGQTLEVAMGTHGPIPKRSEERRRRNKDEGLDLVSRDELVLFFDGSKSDDATGLVGCRLSDGLVKTFGV